MAAKPRKSTTAGQALQAQQRQRTSARDWLAAARGTPVEVPSGNVALLRRPGPEMFLTNGMIPDALSGIVLEAVREKQGLPPEKASRLLEDPSMFPAMIDLIDAATVAACVEPAVRRNPMCIKPNSDGSVCAQPPSADIHSKPKSKDYHVFIEGERIPIDERDPEFLYCSEVAFDDKMFIFQYAVGGSADLERFREEFEQSVASLDGVTGSPE